MSDNTPWRRSNRIGGYYRKPHYQDYLHDKKVDDEINRLERVDLLLDKTRNGQHEKGPES